MPAWPRDRHRGRQRTLAQTARPGLACDARTLQPLCAAAACTAGPPGRGPAGDWGPAPAACGPPPAACRRRPPPAARQLACTNQRGLPGGHTRTSQLPCGATQLDCTCMQKNASWPRCPQSPQNQPQCPHQHLTAARRPATARLLASPTAMARLTRLFALVALVACCATLVQARPPRTNANRRLKGDSRSVSFKASKGWQPTSIALACSACGRRAGAPCSAPQRVCCA